MPKDSERWDQKYETFSSPVPPDPLLVEYEKLFKPFSHIVDLGAGTGRNAIYLAQQQHVSIAVDCSQRAIHEAQRRAAHANVNILGLVADLTDFRFSCASLDAVVCFKYLNRNLMQDLHFSLHGGGYLVFKTFTPNILREFPTFNPDFVLQPGELAQMFENYEVVSIYDDGKPDTQTYSHIVARKPDS